MQLGTQGGSQPREGRNQTVAGTPFSWEEHQDIVQVWVVRAAAKSSDLGRHEHKSEDTVVWQSAFQTEDQNQGAQPPPLTLCVRLQSTLSANLRTGTTEILLP